ncbi:MAG TPA: hypothetical protein VKB52_09075 [Rhodanobacteraceae bacterium]|nr:hypothetical protein [Rhodanobacteraceae bacterium]
MQKNVSAVLLLLFAAFAANAATADKPDPAVNADTKDKFVTVTDWVHKEMNPGGRYEHVTSSDRSTVEAKLAQMGALLDKKGSVEQMNDAEKTEMFNNQEQVNSILAKHDGDRVICKSVAPVGSHIPVKTCKTARQMEGDQREAQKFVQDRQNVQFKSGN